MEITLLAVKNAIQQKGGIKKPAIAKILAYIRPLVKKTALLYRQDQRRMLFLHIKMLVGPVKNILVMFYGHHRTTAKAVEQLPCNIIAVSPFFHIYRIKQAFA